MNVGDTIRTILSYQPRAKLHQYRICTLWDTQVDQLMREQGVWQFHFDRLIQRPQCLPVLYKFEKYIAINSNNNNITRKIVNNELNYRELLVLLGKEIENFVPSREYVGCEAIETHYRDVPMAMTSNVKLSNHQKHNIQIALVGHTDDQTSFLQAVTGNEYSRLQLTPNYLKDAYQTIQVGKTIYALQFIRNTMTDDGGDKQLRIMNYDMCRMIVFLYNPNNRTNFEQLQNRWIPEVNACKPNTLKVLIAVQPVTCNKKSNAGTIVSRSEGEALTQKLGFKCFKSITDDNNSITYIVMKSYLFHYHKSQHSTMHRKSACHIL
jgi:hypothetical protein